MDDGDLMEVNLTDLDLNQEPAADPPFHRVGYGSILNDLESAHNRIEERIRQLEAVTARARQRQRWRQSRNSIETIYFHAETTQETDVRDENSDAGSAVASDRGKGCKRDSSHLVAKALGIDSEIRKRDDEGGSFYDCNICLDLAREPVLTCCGHLFCWACFYQVSKVDSTTLKECPVCKGQVSDASVIPIYGKGSHEIVSGAEIGFKIIPPRPKAPRVESIRQQRMTQGSSHVPVAEALRRIRMSIGAINNQTQVQESGTNSVTDQNLVLAAVAAGPRVRIHQVSRVLSESAASLSSLSSALTDAERLVEDLETAIINNRLSQNRGRAAEMIDPPPGFSNRLSISLQHSQDDPITADAALLPMPNANNAPSSQSADVSPDLHFAPPPYVSLRRRMSSLARNFDRDSQDIRESRRRRLN
ncbi:hypothetical protein M569_06338 [Genlisea aurea]|uniref:E3 ubiquitin-protein ligase RMA n=1 Tax=Genlisea aurea TaxID=192259 RepID=S8CU65_9LAMI|nr:hypothetical protein M569_06338 [Genlisea aurea]